MKTTLVQNCLLLQPWMHAVSSEGAVCQEHGLPRMNKSDWDSQIRCKGTAGQQARLPCHA